MTFDNGTRNGVLVNWVACMTPLASATNFVIATAELACLDDSGDSHSPFGTRAGRQAASGLRIAQADGTAGLRSGG
jgi:hypothetical protein